MTEKRGRGRPVLRRPTGVLSGMEIFVLAVLAATDLGTRYDFMSRLLLSTARVDTALRRLLESGFVEVEEADRGAKRHTITDAGRRALESQWREGTANVPSETETILRHAWVTLVLGGPIPAAAYLRTAAAKRAREAEARRKVAGSMEPTAQGYLAARTHVSAARREAEGRAMLELAEMLAKLAEQEPEA